MGFDFIKGMLGFDILQAEAIARVAARVMAVMIAEMMDAGLTEEQALAVYDKTLRAMLETAATMGKEK